jgi:hypothetical protein
VTVDLHSNRISRCACKKPVRLELRILAPNRGFGNVARRLRPDLRCPHMRNLLLALLHLAVVTVKLCGSGGVRAVMAENLLLKQRLIVLRRARKRASNLTLTTGCCADSGPSSSVWDASARLRLPFSPRHSWRFIKPWSVASTGGYSHHGGVPEAWTERAG